jgi:hypothetical protein
VETIRDAVRSHLGETYIVLTKDGGYDGRDKPDVFGNAINKVMEQLFAPGVVEADLDSRLVRQYVAAAATRDIIPLAIDYTMQRTGRSDTVAAPPTGGRTPTATGQSRTYYDRVAVLKDLDVLLRSYLIENAADFAALSVAVRRVIMQVPVGPRISTSADDLLTLDPQTMTWLSRPGIEIVSGFGVPYVLVAP